MPRKNNRRAGGKKKEEAAAGAGAEEKKEESLKEKGNKAFQQQNYAKALEFYSEAILAEPNEKSLYSNRSATYAAMKNFVKALEDGDKVVELDPDWPKGHFRRGNALEALLRYQEAHEAYKTGLAKDASDAALKKASDELSAVLAELKITEAEMENRNPDTDKFQGLVKWLQDGGAKFPKLYLQYYSEDYRGVHCLAKVPTDDVILYVPHKYIMTSEVAKASDIGTKILSSGVELRSKHSFLASYLLQERRVKNSFWQPYIRILPERYANMPLFFDEEKLSWLTGSFSLGKISERIDSLKREYDAIRQMVPEFQVYAFDEFVWARLVVITRIFGLVIDGNKTDGLVPYADMLNHKRPRETKWNFDDSRYGFIITSLRTIQRGEEVYDSYGRKCNSRFFVNYGFALDENEDNEAILRVQLPRNDPHYVMKIRFLGGREISARREFQIPADYKEKKCKELFSFLRFVHAKDSELMLLSSADGFKLDEIEPISVRNEIKTLEDIRAAAELTLRGFPDSLESDDKLLEEKMADPNLRNCVVQRRGEKQVLKWFIDVATQAVPFLNLPWKDLKRVAAKCYQGTSRFDFYVTSVVVPLVKKAS